MAIRKNRLTAAEYIAGIQAGNRVTLSRAITLTESALPEDQALAQEVLRALLPRTGRSIRIGITGVPGVGKSTFIETFGRHLTAQGKKLAVLAVDPSSGRSKGSILGDKTRMEQLSMDQLAYIRPSPAGGSLGGVARRTRETVLLCEAAGFEVILIETVGVGQSETMVREMVDFFLLLMLAGAGDELQGIKKGIMEMADAIAITKADGDNRQSALLARREYQNALHLFPPSEHGWYPEVVVCSALEQQGIAEIWNLVERYQQEMQQNGFFLRNRQQQQLQWMHETIAQTLREQFYHHPSVRAALPDLTAAVETGTLSAAQAAEKLLSLYRS